MGLGSAESLAASASVGVTVVVETAGGEWEQWEQ